MSKRALGWVFAIVLGTELVAYLAVALSGTMDRHGAGLVALIMAANVVLILAVVVAVIFRRPTGME